MLKGKFVSPCMVEELKQNIWWVISNISPEVSCLAFQNVLKVLGDLMVWEFLVWRPWALQRVVENLINTNMRVCWSGNHTTCLLNYQTGKWLWPWRRKLRDRTKPGTSVLTLILRRSRTGTVWFYTSTSNNRAAWPKLYTESLTRDLKHMYSRLTLVRISINL